MNEWMNDSSKYQDVSSVSTATLMLPVQNREIVTRESRSKVHWQTVLALIFSLMLWFSARMSSRKHWTIWLTLFDKFLFPFFHAFQRLLQSHHLAACYFQLGLQVDDFLRIVLRRQLVFQRLHLQITQLHLLATYVYSYILKSWAGKVGKHVRLLREGQGRRVIL